MDWDLEGASKQWEHLDEQVASVKWLRQPLDLGIRSFEAFNWVRCDRGSEGWEKTIIPLSAQLENPESGGTTD